MNPPAMNRPSGLAVLKTRGLHRGWFHGFDFSFGHFLLTSLSLMRQELNAGKTFMPEKTLSACLKILRDRIVLIVVLILILKKPAKADDEDEHEEEEERSDSNFSDRLSTSMAKECGPIQIWDTCHGHTVQRQAAISTLRHI